jgi:hypothetical protein
MSTFVIEPDDAAVARSVSALKGEEEFRVV